MFELLVGSQGYETLLCGSQVDEILNLTLAYPHSVRKEYGPAGYHIVMNNLAPLGFAQLWQLSWSSGWIDGRGS
jgi:hypothetical protein